MSRDIQIRKPFFEGEMIVFFDSILSMGGFFVITNRRARRLTENAEDLHGSARWASEADVRETGLLEANAECLDAGIAELWRRNEGAASGIFLVGHSVGGAVAILIAARERQWPLLGIAVSGVGLTLPPGEPVYQPEATAVRISCGRTITVRF